MLIDSRNRLEGELEKLSVLKYSAAELHDRVSASLKAIDEGLAEIKDRFDSGRVRKIRSLKTTARGQYGLLTRLVVSALKAGEGIPMTTRDVFSWVLAHWPDGAARPETDPHFRVNMRRRLRALRSRGFVLSPEVGHGGTTITTWMLNPLGPEQDEDTLSTLFADDSPGSTR